MAGYHLTLAARHRQGKSPRGPALQALDVRRSSRIDEGETHDSS